MNYLSLAFTDTIKAIQQRMGSRSPYERATKTSFVEGLTELEMGFIGQMDSFYLASFGENGYPYVQHRGGPAGFIKVIDKDTIGIIDFSGNRQYISVGNIATNPNVSLILVSYPVRARLKIYAQAEIVEIAENPALFDLLNPKEYGARAERIMLFHIKAYDWNCQQHITPRYTAAEIEASMKPQQEYIAKLEEEVKLLREELREKNP
jgi:predicted pyridoxine 5'-phosphate oxidase superfamily flavin-nucleotide-binding protein